MTGLRSPPPALQRKLHLHQQWLESSGTAGKRFNGHYEDFTHLNLEGVDLSLGLLTGCHFDRSNLQKAWYIGATLDDATFIHCHIRGTRFDYAVLEQANFVGTAFNQASFKGADTDLIVWSKRDVECAITICDLEREARGQVHEKIGEQRTSNPYLGLYIKKQRAAAQARHKAQVPILLEFWRSQKQKTVDTPRP